MIVSSLVGTKLNQTQNHFIIPCLNCISFNTPTNCGDERIEIPGQHLLLEREREMIAIQSEM